MECADCVGRFGRASESDTGYRNSNWEFRWAAGDELAISHFAHYGTEYRAGDSCPYDELYENCHCTWICAELLGDATNAPQSSPSWPSAVSNSVRDESNVVYDK
ncbi:hypothetical protein D3C77_349660 [compost metagenome]